MRKTIVTCDGCDAEQGGSVHIKPVTIDIQGGHRPIVGWTGVRQYDLCEPCSKTLTSQTNPRKWPREDAPDRRKTNIRWAGGIVEAN